MHKLFKRISIILTALIFLTVPTGCRKNKKASENNSNLSTGDNTEALVKLTGKNIIFIQADQFAAASVNSYGSGVNSTTAIDSLSEQGVRFNRAYANVPVCAPNRACILTSRSYQVNGVKSNNIPLNDNALTYAGALGAYGYNTAAFGKYHQRDMAKATPADPRFMGFDEGVITEDTKWGPWLDWVRYNAGDQQFDLALGATWNHGKRQIPEEIMDQVQNSRVDNYWTPLKKKSFWEQVYQSPMDKNYTDAVFITEKAIEFLDKQVKDSNKKPFLCSISYVDPHDPYDPPAPYSTMFKPEDMPAPIKNEWAEEGIQYLKKNQEWLNFKKIADSPEDIKKMRAYYHGKVKMMDDQIQRIIDYVKNNNMWDNTVIIFTSDHGDMMGDHGLIAKYLPHYDKSVRVPLVVAGGGVKHAVIDDLVSSLDFFPTFLDIAGIPPEPYPSLEGKSFAGYLYDEPVTEKWDAIFIDSHTVQSVITKEGMRYTKANTGEQQLFNLTKDPDEINNLAKNDEYKDIMLDLNKRMNDLMNRYKKFGQLQTMDYFGDYPVDVYINDCRIAFDNMPLTYKDKPYIPVEKVFKSLGAEYKQSGNTVIIKKAGKLLTFKIGKNVLTIGDKTLTLASPFRKLNNAVQAPAEFFEQCLNELKYNARYDTKNNTLVIDGLVF